MKNLLRRRRNSTTDLPDSKTDIHTSIRSVRKQKMMFRLKSLRGNSFSSYNSWSTADLPSAKIDAVRTSRAVSYPNLMAEELRQQEDLETRIPKTMTKTLINQVFQRKKFTTIHESNSTDFTEKSSSRDERVYTSNSIIESKFQAIQWFLKESEPNFNKVKRGGKKSIHVNGDEYGKPHERGLADSLYANVKSPLELTENRLLSLNELRISDNRNPSMYPKDANEYTLREFTELSPEIEAKVIKKIEEIVHSLAKQENNKLSSENAALKIKIEELTITEKKMKIDQCAIQNELADTKEALLEEIAFMTDKLNDQVEIIDTLRITSKNE